MNIKQNAGLVALTVESERNEIKVVTNQFVEKHHSPTCAGNHPRIVFGFWQKDLEGRSTPYWHVMNPGRSYHSSLSMRGLRDWKVI